jgi:hypothetical protein
MYVVKNGVLVATNMQGSGGGNSDTEATVYNAYGTALVDVVAGDRIAVALLDLTGAWSHARLVDIDCMMSVGFVPLSSGASYVYARRSADLTLTPVALATAAPFPFNSEVVDTHNEFDDATGVFTASRRCLVLAVAAVGVGAASTSSSPAYALVLCKHDATDAVVDYAGGEVYERMFPDTVTLGFGLRAEGMFFLEPGEKVSAKVHLMHGTATARLFNGASVNQQTLQRFHVLALPIL